MPIGLGPLATESVPRSFLTKSKAFRPSTLPSALKYSRDISHNARCRQALPLKRFYTHLRRVQTKGAPKSENGAVTSVDSLQQVAWIEEGHKHPKHSHSNHSEKIGKRKPQVRRRNKRKERSDPTTWVRILDDFLPQHLRAIPLEGKRKPVIGESYHLQILQTLWNARNSGFNLLAHIGFQQRRWKAVLWLVETLLLNVSATSSNERSTQCPSNIVWGPANVSLADLTKSPIHVERFSHADPRPIDQFDQFQLDPRYSDILSEQKNDTMSEIWYSLGWLIIESAELPEDEGSVAMAAVYQIIASIHNHALVPHSVYSYTSSDYSTTTQRPPILHLLSSRILTTLSDATWRSHQDDVIEQAVKLGTSLKDLVNDLPGGRFRLKVRPLGPEVWLEFVLWCCVDGGFARQGAQIIARLQKKTQNSWFAVQWTSSPGKEPPPNSVDWERVKLRHGGSVGLIEGYNREAPFVEMEPRTISTEVVLSIVETLANSVNVGVQERGTSVRWVIEMVKTLFEFLEPHDLSREYFDYMTVRLLQTGSFEGRYQPETLPLLCNTMSHIRSLDSTKSLLRSTASFDFESVLGQTEVHAGILHHTLDVFVDRADVRRAVDIFNQIQEFVDVSKVNSIASFFGTASAADTKFFSHGPATANVDYLRSHGQLPDHKLAAFLDLTTTSKLFGVGQWMLYSEDVDVPLIPPSAYNLPGVAASLVRFAGASGDLSLLHHVSKRARLALKPSVNVLRSLANAYISTSRFDRAKGQLQELTRAKAGGYGLSNLAHLGAALLDLESRYLDSHDAITVMRLNEAKQLMEQILNGTFDGGKGDFSLDVNAVFRREVSCLLKVFSSIPSTSLPSFANKWQSTYGYYNTIGLTTSHFNVLLAAVVDIKGSQEGMRLWDRFCADPRSSIEADRLKMVGDFFIQEEFLSDKDFWQRDTYVRSADESPSCLLEDVPFAPYNSQAADTALQYADNRVLVPEDETTEFVNGRAVLPGKSDIEENTLCADSKDGVEVEAILAVPKSSGFTLENAPFVERFHSTASRTLGASPKVENDSSEDDQSQASDPVLVPDISTLRIIVRAAIAERGTLEAGGADASGPTQVLEWATQFYRAFGTSPELFEQETRLPAASFESLSEAPVITEKAAFFEQRTIARLSGRGYENVAHYFQRGATVTRMPYVEEQWRVRERQDRQREGREEGEEGEWQASPPLL